MPSPKGCNMLLHNA